MMVASSLGWAWRRMQVWWYNRDGDKSVHNPIHHDNFTAGPVFLESAIGGSVTSWWRCFFVCSQPSRTWRHAVGPCLSWRTGRLYEGPTPMMNTRGLDGRMSCMPVPWSLGNISSDCGEARFPVEVLMDRDSQIKYSLGAGPASADQRSGNPGWNIHGCPLSTENRKFEMRLSVNFLGYRDTRTTTYFENCV